MLLANDVKEVYADVSCGAREQQFWGRIVNNQSVTESGDTRRLSAGAIQYG